MIASGDPSKSLTKINAMMRRIDLSCKLLGAVSVGFIMSTMCVSASAVFIAVWNITCVGFEYWLLLSVYNKTPGLHERTRTDLEGLIMNTFPAVAEEHVIAVTEENGKNTAYTPYNNSLQVFKEQITKLHQQSQWEKILHLPLFEGWKVYIRQEMMLAGVALSFLSVNVLSFGTLMTASLKWRGVPAYVLGLSRGIAALIGICATLTYPFLHARLRTLKAGLWAVSLQWSFLSLCVISVWLHSLTASTALLMGGAAAARAGLWMFDLSVTQLMQESVPEVERGVVAGVQNSMQSLFQLLSFVAGMLISNPQDFSKLIFMSFGSVTMAAVIYAIQVYHKQLTIDHLFGSL